MLSGLFTDELGRDTLFMPNLHGLRTQNPVKLAGLSRFLAALFASATHTGARLGFAVHRQVDFRSLILCTRATLLRIFLVRVSS